LRFLAKDPEVGEITVFAHSMGNWVTLEAMRQMAFHDGKVAEKIHDVILAAYPAIARAHAALREAGATAPLLSGSGSCLFALAEREADARAIAARFEAGAAEALFVCALHHDDAWR